MYLYFGIRTINQTRQVEQLCSLRKKKPKHETKQKQKQLAQHSNSDYILITNNHYSNRTLQIWDISVLWEACMELKEDDLYIDEKSCFFTFYTVHTYMIWFTAVPPCTCMTYTCIQVLTPKTKILTPPVQTPKFKVACDISLRHINVI